MGSTISAAAGLLAIAAAACGPGADDNRVAAPGNDAAAAAPEKAPTVNSAKGGDQRADARGVEDPRAFIAEQYAAMARDPDEVRPPVDYAYSDRLRALFEAYDVWTAEHGPLGALDFDWWTNSQDWVLSGLRVTEASAGPDRRIVSANFMNGDRPDQIRFLFVRQGGRWFLDDAVEGTGGGGEGWTLSDLLRQRE